MANKLIDMSKVRKVIQLHHQGKAKQFISKYLSLLEKTVKVTTQGRNKMTTPADLK